MVRLGLTDSDEGLRGRNSDGWTQTVGSISGSDGVAWMCDSGMGQVVRDRVKGAEAAKKADAEVRAFVKRANAKKKK
jgi:hypothetical protein